MFFLVRYLFVIIAFFSICLSVESHAAVEIRGFGNASAQKIDLSKNFTNNYVSKGQTVDLSSGTNFGVNFYSRLTDTWSVAAQLVAKPQAVSPGEIFDWGFLSLKATPELALRFGRVISPVWLYSQNKQVGYNYVWVSLPEELYALNNIGSLNGVSALGKLNLGASDLQMEFAAGAADERNTDHSIGGGRDSLVHLTNTFVLDLRYSYRDWFLYRFGAGSSNVRAEVIADTALPAGAVNSSVLVPVYLQTTTKLDVGKARLFSTGFRIDKDNFLASGEFVRRYIAGASQSSASALYAMVGHRFGKITPHFTYSWQGNLGGTFWLHPDYPATSTLQKDAYSFSPGLNFQPAESVIVKSEVSASKQRYMDSSRDLVFRVYRLSVNFIY